MSIVLKEYVDGWLISPASIFAHKGAFVLSIRDSLPDVEKSTLDYDFEICCAETLFEKIFNKNINQCKYH